MGRKKAAKPKFEKYQVIREDEDPGLYERLERLVESGHKSQLEPAHIALAWAHDVKPDKDGFWQLWAVKVPSKVDRGLHGKDLVIILNDNAWRALPEKHDAILDEALCACVREVDKHGDFKEDAKGRPVFHVRKAPLRVFPENIRRHGFWLQAVTDFVRENAPKLPPPEPRLPGFEEARPEARRSDAPIGADVAAAVAGAAAAKEYRGFAQTGRAKAGKALSIDEAHATIDRFHAAPNVGAGKPIARLLEEAGWDQVRWPAGGAPASIVERPTGLDIARAQIALAEGDRAPAERVLAAAERATPAPAPQQLSQGLRGRLASAALVFVGTVERHGDVKEEAVTLALNGYVAAKGRKRQEKEALELLARLGWAPKTCVELHGAGASS